MIYEICYFRSLVEKLGQYLYGDNVDRTILTQALQREQNPTATLSLLVLHHNRRTVGLLSLAYQHHFSRCESEEDYRQYFRQLTIVPPAFTSPSSAPVAIAPSSPPVAIAPSSAPPTSAPVTPPLDPAIITQYHLRYRNYYQCFTRLLYDRTIPLLEMTGHDIISYCYTIFLRDHPSAWDQYHNVTYRHHGMINTISVRHLLLALLANEEPLTHRPFDPAWYSEAVTTYQRELAIFESFYYHS